MTKQYDVVIIGGGVSGTALYYLLAKYTHLKRVALIEKYSQLAAVSSHAASNSQTMHYGDIETNYSLEKALKVKHAADMLVNYVEQIPNQKIVYKYPKMILGIGDEEVAFLRDRYTVFSQHFPALQLLEKHQVSELEPNVVNLRNGQARPEELLALSTVNEYSTVNFAALANSFVEQVAALSNNNFEIHMPAQVDHISKEPSGYLLDTSVGKITANVVVVCAGTYSLLFAQAMGYGENYTGLPISGGFYYTPNILNGKVYTVQNDKLPFAAVHGDPDLLQLDKTRFGPTATILPKLERYGKQSTKDFFRMLEFNSAVRSVLWQFMKDRDIRRFMIKNLGYLMPVLHRMFFLKAAQKIVPSLQLKDIKRAKGTGGVRIQLIDKKEKSLMLGEAKIDQGDGIIFNMTPSPGATSCLASAEEDAKSISQYLNIDFDLNALEADLKK